LSSSRLAPTVNHYEAESTMTMIAPSTCRVTGGVDTHGDTNVAAVLNSATGRLLGTESFDTTTAGYTALAQWMAGHGALDQVGIESTGSYRAGLARHLTASGIAVVKVDRADRKSRRFNGKTDAVDAEAAARAVLAGIATAVPKTHDGHVEAVRVLEVVHHSATKDRTRAINQFHALVITAPDQLRDRFRGQSLAKQLSRARRLAEHGDITETAVRVALRELAKRITDLDSQLARLEQRLRSIVAEHAPALIGIHGVGPLVAAQLLASVGDNPNRIRSEAAFAKLAGVCPLPASSGKTQRLRLNRGGDRRANNALHTIVLVACATTNPPASTSPGASPRPSPRPAP
jgi:transposase